MKTTTKRMKTKTIALTLGLILVSGGLYAADPFEGTWKLNESKSKLTRGAGKDTKIVYNSRLIRDKVTVTTDGIDGDGTPIHSEWKGRFDGKDYKVTGDPDADMRSYKKINDQTLGYHLSALFGGHIEGSIIHLLVGTHIRIGISGDRVIFAVEFSFPLAMDRRSVAFEAVSRHGHLVADETTVIDDLGILVGTGSDL